eukprot:7158120-Prymnesium_polylepis.1
MRAAPSRRDGARRQAGRLRLCVHRERKADVHARGIATRAAISCAASDVAVDHAVNDTVANANDRATARANDRATANANGRATARANDRVNARANDRATARAAPHAQLDSHHQPLQVGVRLAHVRAPPLALPPLVEPLPLR